jgi:hypothetical protein
MRLECLKYVKFRDIVIDFLYNPVPKHIQIFLQREEACEILTNIIIDLIKAIDKEKMLTPQKSSAVIKFQSKEGSLIEIRPRENLAYSCCGARGSIVIGDTGYSVEDTFDILLPLANIDVQEYYYISSNEIVAYWEDKHKKGLEEIDYWNKVKNKKSNQLSVKGEEDVNKEPN